MPIVSAAGIAAGSGGTVTIPTSTAGNLVECAMAAATEQYFARLSGPTNNNQLREKKLTVRAEVLRLMSEGFCDEDQIIPQALATVFPER